MKYLLLILMCVLPFVGVSQNQITLKNENTFIAIIEGVYRKEMLSLEKIPGTEIDRIQISEIQSIAGKVPKYRIKSIHKVNPKVVFLPGKFTRKDVKEQHIAADFQIDNNALAYKPYNQGTKPAFTAGDYIYSAGQRYLTGMGVSVGGAVLVGLGASTEEDAFIYVGGAAMLTGFIISITGHIQLKKAGTKMNSDAVTLSAAQSGVGVSVNF